MGVKRFSGSTRLAQLIVPTVALLTLAGVFLIQTPSPVKGVAANEIAWATDVTAGGSHSCAIYNLGTPYCWGDNGDGQLGTGNTTNHLRPYPVNISGLVTGLVFKQISAGFFHTCAVVGLSGSDASDAVYCWGKNDRGQLGLGTANSTPVTAPTAVTSPSGLVAKKVAAGFAHTCAIYGAAGSNFADKAYCWGNNDEGALGDGTGYYDYGTSTFTTLPTSRVSPNPVVTTLMSSSVSDISAGAMTSCTVAGGVTYCWGANGSGQLGSGTLHSSSSPVASVSSTTNASAGWFFGCTITSGSAMSCWGDNTSGQLGTGDNSSSQNARPVSNLGGSGKLVKQIATGYAHTCAIAGASGVATNDALYCWGENADGQILNGTTGTNTNLPGLAVLTNVPSGQIPKKVATGWAHTMAIYGSPDSQISGDVYGCGDNSDGQVGDNTSNSCDVLVPVDTTDVVGLDISIGLSSHSVAFSVEPTSTGESGGSIATVTTLVPTGYSLTIEADGSDLVCNVGSTPPTIPSLVSDGAFPAGESRWGWNLGTLVSGSWQAPTTWQTIPVGSPKLIASTNSASALAGDDYGIYFGARVNYQQEPCNDYTQDVTLTATSKP